MGEEVNTSLDLIAQAKAEIAKEENAEAVTALKDVLRKLRKLSKARKVVANYERALADLEARVANGRFDIR